MTEKKDTYHDHTNRERKSKAKVGVELWVLGERGGGDGVVLERLGS